MADPSRGPVICICGPTASGKSALADTVAETLHSEVVSIDAMQVYRGMDIGTAKTAIMERRVPLHMVDVADVHQDYSVALFQQEARECIDKLLDRGMIPVLCGGTGLYLNAVIDEMEFPAGSVSTPRRAEYEQQAAQEGSYALWEYLRDRDEQSAQLIHPHNTKRIIRALEMLDDGTSYAQQHAQLHVCTPHYDAHIWGLGRDRARLYQRINARVDVMMQTGLVDEVRALVDKGLRVALTSHQAIGYKEILDALDGKISLEAACDAIKLHSRHYAKRQLSWFRHDSRIHWLNMDTITTEQACACIIDDIHADAGTLSLVSNKD